MGTGKLEKNLQLQVAVEDGDIKSYSIHDVQKTKRKTKEEPGSRSPLLRPSLNDITSSLQAPPPKGFTDSP